MKPKALIYARVSSLLQKEQGHGLESQEHRCREYAATKDYEVEHVFRDSFTGGGDFMLRPAMSQLIQYIDEHPHVEYVLIFDDLKRFARDTVNHIKLRQALDSRGVKVECPNFTFENTPEGEFVETILAAGAELERKQNKRQVGQKMKARLEEGYWPFNSKDIPGYQRQDTKARDWVLVHKEPEASIIREAFERYADGRLLEQMDVARFFEERRLRKKVYVYQVKRIFTRSLYAGFVEYEPWDVERRVGKHEPIVSLKVFNAVQEKLNGKSYTFTRKDVHEDFPLRGLVVCECCGKKMTGSWSSGRTKRYAYYRCNDRHCKAGNKSVSSDVMGKNFEEILRSVEPREKVLKLGERIAMDVWQQREQGLVENAQKVEKELTVIKSKVSVLTERIVNAKSETVASAYEAEIEKLTLQEQDLYEVLKRKTAPSVDFGTAWAEVVGYIKSPYEIWANDDLMERRLVTRLVFAGDIPYHYENGFGTTNLSPILRFFQAVSTSKTQDVEMAGVEPASESGREGESTVHS